MKFTTFWFLQRCLVLHNSYIVACLHSIFITKHHNIYTCLKKMFTIVSGSDVYDTWDNGGTPLYHRVVSSCWKFLAHWRVRFRYVIGLCILSDRPLGLVNLPISNRRTDFNYDMKYKVCKTFIWATMVIILVIL